MRLGEGYVVVNRSQSFFAFPPFKLAMTCYMSSMCAYRESEERSVDGLDVQGSLKP